MTWKVGVSLSGITDLVMRIGGGALLEILLTMYVYLDSSFKK